MPAPTQPVFRFAPSPNGYLHLGHARSALLNHDLARQSGGRLLLRIEDIDPVRSKPEFAAAIKEDLTWLGLQWETPVRVQSRHMADYAAALARLDARGLIYPCICTRGEILRAADTRKNWPRDPDGAPHYTGVCRALAPVERARRIAAGEPYALRLDVTKALAQAPALEWIETGSDNASRNVSAKPALWGDAVLARKDVPVSYHLAVVADDALQDVTHVVRGQDLYAATHLHRLLQHLLGLPTPQYRHHPLILDEDGAKLAKSRLSKPLRQLRAEGASPDDIRRLAAL
jgi:glutamyl-Q tRNA(Asp) synthetase